MAHFPEWMDRTEKQITNRLFSAVLKAEPQLEARIYDGEEMATGWTRDRATLQAATAQTDRTIVQLRRQGDGGKVGAIALIHGNGEDLISDASWQRGDDAAETLIDSICDHANADALA